MIIINLTYPIIQYKKSNPNPLSHVKSRSGTLSFSYYKAIPSLIPTTLEPKITEQS